MKNRLCKSFVLIMLLLVTFFSIKLNSYAASFAYKDFNWEEFAEKNKSYWISACDSDTTGTCVDKILATKERFYTRLYELLAQVPSSYGFIDDNIIIATVFYGLTDESFSDPNDEKYNPYKLDDDDASVTKNKYIGGDDGDIRGAIAYFSKETDSLKTLINNFIGYKTTCYGDSNETPQEYTDKETGVVSYSCPSDAYQIIDNKCVVKLDEYKGSFFDSIGLSWLGTKSDNKCSEIAKEKGFDSSFPKSSSTKEVNVDFFWNFLENENYLDSKDHLQEYYTGILGSVKKDHMNELEPDEILEYRDEIIEVRKRLIQGIKEVLKYYENVSKQYNKSSKVLYWWPIGSESTVEEDGIIYAKDVPSKTYISSNYGFRVDPYDNSRNAKHNGIDIPGDLGVTNVIASQDGVVSYIENICPDTPDENCGSGYGNHVIIQHSDGNYTLYAHLSNNTITVNVGDSVKKGQVLGKVGNSGKSTDPHLHFEVRVGGNDYNSGQDPLVFVSSQNPRSSGGGDIIIPEEFGNAGFFTYTNITKINWVYNQKKVYDIWRQKGAKIDRNVAMIDDRYLIACTTLYGNIGDKIDFYLGDGTKIETIMMDAKSEKTDSGNKWGHNDGQQILEFEITTALNGSGDVGSWMGWSGQRVASATNLGDNIIK